MGKMLSMPEIVTVDLELENKYCSAHSLNTEIFLLCFVMMGYARSLGLCVLLDSPQLVGPS